MKTRRKHLYHGPALGQILEDHRCDCLKKAEDKKYGHYAVNCDTHLLVKYATTYPWAFTFSADDVCTLATDVRTKGQAFLCLVCGIERGGVYVETVCLLDKDEIDHLLDFSCPREQWIKVDASGGPLMQVWGAKGRLEHEVSSDSFPDGIFRIRL